MINVKIFFSCTFVFEFRYVLDYKKLFGLNMSYNGISYVEISYDDVNCAEIVFYLLFDL